MPTASSSRIAATGGLAVFVLGLGLAISRGLDDGEREREETTPELVAPAPRPKPAAQPKRTALVPLRAAGAFDPEGDGRERDEEAGLAVDGRGDTAWRTERYSSFFKSGVGLVLDAGHRVRVEEVVVDTPTPGIRAEIRLGDDRQGPFATAAAARALGSTTRFRVPRRAGRYVVVWIVGLPPSSAGEIAEVRLRARR
jgi:hypothetical protein